jgi:vacuolar-type H+-ATPase subunit H
MTKVISFLKKIRFDRIAIAFFAGILLLVTGCSRANATVPGSNPARDAEIHTRVPAPNSSGTAGTYNDRVGQQTELYDPIQKRKGGMNEFSDVDPRAATDRVNKKASDLVRNADQNIQKVNSPEEYAEDYRQGKPFGERVKDLVDSVTDSASDTAEDASKGARRGAENLKDNAQTAGREFSKGVRRGGEDAAADAQNKTGQAVRGTQRGVTDAADALNKKL